MTTTKQETIETLAKYPFRKAAEEYVDELNLTLTKIVEPEYKKALDRAEGARFITQQGAIIGMAAMAAAVIATITPIFVNQFVLRAALGLPVATSLTIAIAGAISYICYRSASASAEKLYVMGVN